MPEQTGKNFRVVYAPEAEFNTRPAANSAIKAFRTNPSPGLALTRPTIVPGEVRSDGLTPMGRLGSRTVSGSYNADLSQGSFDDILEAVLRGTWVDPNKITEVDMTSITTAAGTITATAGSWITQGVRVGDIIRLADHSAPGNNNRNIRVIGVTERILTVADTLVVAAADNDFDLTIQKKLTNATTPTRRSFQIEQYFQDIDRAQLFGGCRFHGMTLRGSPDGMATLEFPVTGASMAAQSEAASPYFTEAPTRSTTDGLTFVDSRLRYGGSDIAIATSFELALVTPAAGLPIIGGQTTPDVFDDETTITGSITVLRRDLDNIAALDDETEFELAVLLEDTGADPKGFVSVFVPRIKLSAVDAPLGESGGLIETLNFFAGKKEGVEGYDNSMLTICTGA